MWLGKHNWHQRYYGAMRVFPNDPTGAAREIEKWAGHRFFNQVYIPPESGEPYGHPRFDPLWEAAARHGMPVSMHLIIQPGQRWLTPVGFSSYHLESYSLWFLRYVGQLTSMVLSGVFERHPGLTVVGLEAGISWLPPLMWRLDNYFEALDQSCPTCAGGRRTTCATTYAWRRNRSKSPPATTSCECSNGVTPSAW